jgi:hypothetical protein
MTIVREFAVCFLFVFSLAIIFVAACGTFLLLRTVARWSARVFWKIRTPALVPAVASITPTTMSM